MNGRAAAGATFIVGDPRSGTSLLRALLDGHPELLVLPFETHLFDWVSAADPATAVLARTRLFPTLDRHRSGWSSAAVEAALRDAFADAPDPRARLLALVDGWAWLTARTPSGGAEGGLVGVPAPRSSAASPTPSRWVEKTPRHLYELSTLFRWFPDARVLALRRDPRDVIASELRRRRRPLLPMVLARRVAARALADWRNDPRVAVVRYEDLVTDPEREMRRVCAFLDVRWDPCAAEPTVMGAPYTGNSRFDAELRGVSGVAVGRHRDALDTRRRRTVDALLAPVLSEGGYPVDGPQGSTAQGGGAQDGDAKGAGPSGSRTATPAVAAARLAIELVLRSGLWRLRAVRSAFRAV